MNRALFLDRDGIFNELVYYDGKPHSPRDWSEVRHYPGLEALPGIRQLGFLLILVTNQPDVERGIYSAAFVEEVNAHYQKLYKLDAVYYSPFRDNTHPWKKPNPGMFEQAARDHRIDLKRSFHLGDTGNDLEAAKRCGCTALLWDREYNRELACPHRVRSLAEVIALLKKSTAE